MLGQMRFKAQKPAVTGAIQVKQNRQNLPVAFAGGDDLPAAGNRVPERRGAGAGCLDAGRLVVDAGGVGLDVAVKPLKAAPSGAILAPCAPLCSRC